MNPTFRTHRPVARWTRIAGLGLFLALAPARAQAPTFEASAAVPVMSSEDLVRARAQALNDAIGRALEQAVAQVAPEARSRLYLILGRARDYVANYRVLEEGEQSGQFQIRVEVQLDLPRVLRELQAAPGRQGVSKLPVAVCSTDASAEAQAAVGAARVVLAERVGTVEVLDAAGCTARLGAGPGGPGSGLLLALTPDPSPRSEEIRGTQPPRFGAVAHAEWQLYRPGGDPLKEAAEGTVFLDSAGAALLEAQRASALAGLGRLLARPGALPQSAPGVLLSIEGIGSYANYQQLLKALAALPGVSRAEPRRFASPSGVEGGQVQILLHTAAATTTEAIGAALARAPLGGLRLQVAPAGPAELRVLCAPTGVLPSPTDEAPAADPTETERAP